MAQSADAGQLRRNQSNALPIAHSLVVDDDRLLRQMVRDFLEGADFAVAEAVDGADGVCRTVQGEATTQAIPVAFLTASTDPRLTRQALCRRGGGVPHKTVPTRGPRGWSQYDAPRNGPPREAERGLRGRTIARRKGNALMSQTIYCRYCQLPQQINEDETQAGGEIYRSSCGGPLPLGSRAAVRSTTILWIDDDRLLLSVCAAVLEREGYRVLFATDGATGIVTAKQERPDVILLDVVMPTMTGLEVCQQLRADPDLKDTPIILLTALEDAGVGTMGEKAGATTTLRKPFGPEYVVEFLEQLLRRKSGPPRL